MCPSVPLRQPGSALGQNDADVPPPSNIICKVIVVQQRPTQQQTGNDAAMQLQLMIRHSAPCVADSGSRQLARRAAPAQRDLWNFVCLRQALDFRGCKPKESHIKIKTLPIRIESDG